MGMTLSRLEQETIVNYNAAEQTATVYTRDKTYSMSKSLVSYRKPRKLTDEQRERARCRIKQ